MESYRHATYRYSTGQGFNVNVNVPKKAQDVASFKMSPLVTNLVRPSFTVNIAREADRVSMQAEAGMQQIKVLGYDATAGKNFRKLKARLEVIKHLMIGHSIKYIKKADLEKIYSLYERGVPDLDKKIREIVEQNKKAGGVKNFVGAAFKSRKGYPLYDQFGQKLRKEDYKKFEREKSLKGFGMGDTNNLIRVIGVFIIVSAILKWAS